MSCAAIRVSRAAVPVSQDVWGAVAVRPTMAPTATPVTQSNGVNSAIVRRSVSRNAAAAVRNNASALTAA